MARVDTGAWRPAALVERRPLGTAVGLVVALGALRVVDVLALRSHETVGALAPSTAAALALAAGYLWVARPHPGPGDLAVDRRSISLALVVGVGGVGAVQLLARGAEAAALALTGHEPVLVLAPLNPATRATGWGAVAGYLASGVVLTALGEELLFRRVLLGALARGRSFRRANAAQAALFGAWHLAWPLTILVSPVSPFAPFPVYAGGLLVVTAAVGAVLGWLVRATGTVWTAVAAHLLHNGTVVFLRVEAAGAAVRGSAAAATVVAGYVVLAWLAWRRYGATTSAEGDG